MDCGTIVDTAFSESVWEGASPIAPCRCPCPPLTSQLSSAVAQWRLDPLPTCQANLGKLACEAFSDDYVRQDTLGSPAGDDTAADCFTAIHTTFLNYQAIEAALNAVQPCLEAAVDPGNPDNLSGFKTCVQDFVTAITGFVAPVECLGDHPAALKIVSACFSPQDKQDFQNFVTGVNTGMQELLAALRQFPATPGNKDERQEILDIAQQGQTEIAADTAAAATLGSALLASSVTVVIALLGVATLL